MLERGRPELFWAVELWRELVLVASLAGEFNVAFLGLFRYKA